MAEKTWTLADFSYDLPEEKIAQRPLDVRSDSKLLVLNEDGLRDDRFANLPVYLKPGDCLVINDTKVIPARLIGTRQNGAPAEIFLLKRLNLTTWEALCRPGKKIKPGECVRFSDTLACVVLDRLADGVRRVEFAFSGVFEALLAELGETPLPPYIHEKLADPTRYQTVYAVHDGSAAAPTAGLHFTETMLAQLEACGIALVRLTLHVGLGTFRPVREQNLDDHIMHEEHYVFPEEAAQQIMRTRQHGGRVIAVGTTSARVLESVAARLPLDKLTALEGDTRLFIRPGYTFLLTDGLITNFHLPESTLLMMVAAFIGYDRIMAAYHHAVETNYRFFSFGDACLLLPGKDPVA